MKQIFLKIIIYLFCAFPLLTYILPKSNSFNLLSTLELATFKEFYRTNIILNSVHITHKSQFPFSHIFCLRLMIFKCSCCTLWNRHFLWVTSFISISTFPVLWLCICMSSVVMASSSASEFIFPITWCLSAIIALLLGFT